MEEPQNETITPEATESQLVESVKKQVEYYFSKENLLSDPFLTSQMDAQMCVPIHVVMKFAWLKALTQDESILRKALQDSTIVSIQDNVIKVTPSMDGGAFGYPSRSAAATVPATTDVLRCIQDLRAEVRELRVEVADLPQMRTTVAELREAQVANEGDRQWAGCLAWCSSALETATTVLLSLKLPGYAMYTASGAAAAGGGLAPFPYCRRGVCCGLCRWLAAERRTSSATTPASENGIGNEDPASPDPLITHE